MNPVVTTSPARDFRDARPLTNTTIKEDPHAEDRLQGTEQGVVGRRGEHRSVRAREAAQRGSHPAAQALTDGNIDFGTVGLEQARFVLEAVRCHEDAVRFPEVVSQCELVVARAIVAARTAEAVAS